LPSAAGAGGCFFFHPDFTVASGFSPDQPSTFRGVAGFAASRAASPPVGNRLLQLQLQQAHPALKKFSGRDNITHAAQVNNASAIVLTSAPARRNTTARRERNRFARSTMSMQSDLYKNAPKLLTALLLFSLLAAVSIFVVALLLVPAEQQSSSFWLRVTWTEFLALLVWGFFGNFLSRSLRDGKQQPGLKRILLSASAVLIAYTSCSMLILFGAPKLSVDWQVLIETILAATAMCLFAIINVARLRAAAQFQPAGLGPNPVEILTAKLRLHEERFPPDQAGPSRQLHNSLCTFRQTLEQTLPRTGRIAQLEDYKDFTQQFDRLCAELQSLSAASLQPADAERVETTLQRLHDQANYISFIFKL
jgi:hypothetical protein